MADPTPHTDSTSDTATTPDRGSPPRMPRWVKWPGIVIGILVLLFIVLRFAGFEHGPGQHTPGDQPTEQAPGGHMPGQGDH